MWILYEDDNSKVLKTLADSKTVNCCMDTQTWRPFLRGIARVFYYVQKDKEFTAPVD
jgi:hypothetical protein